MHCRIDFMDLANDAAALDRLADALNELYDNGVIQAMATQHDVNFFNGIHWAPQFLPWHRHFLLRIEQQLQAIDARIVLPYWDWTRADSRNLDAEPWKSFFGGRNNTDGRFDHWAYTRGANDDGNVLPTLDDIVEELRSKANFTAYRAIECGSHFPGHTWTGGTMTGGDSPLDPLFYLHHGNLDRLWAIWQRNNPGSEQYSTTGIGCGSQFNVAPVDLNDPMVAGATPASMLDHLVLGFRYPRDVPLEVEVAGDPDFPNFLSGDPTEVMLETPQIVFNDVPTGDTTMRAALYTVEGCEPLLFEVESGPTGDFSLFEPGPFPHPAGPLPTNELRIWLLFTGQTPNTNANGLISIRAVSAETGVEVNHWNDIPISANSIARPTAAVALILDESGSMLSDAGNNRDTRLEVLQVAATTFIDQLFDDNGLMMVAFDETGDLLAGLDVAGGQTSGVRDAARTAIQNHGPPNNQPHTSIGAGIQTAADGYAASPLTSTFDVQAMVVFTDGLEDREPWIRDVETQIPDRVYAVGVANAANVDSNKLREIANNTGGFMLHQGAVTQDDEFLLEKFFIQILAGVLNRDIVADPPGLAVPGVIDSVPFPINRSDVQFDAVVLTRFPQALIMGLRTPDGTVIGPTELPADTVRLGATSGTLRITLPLVVDGNEHWEGDWELLLALGKGHTSRSTAVGGINFGETFSLPYHAIVHARSSLNLRATLAQTGQTPGSDLLLEAILTEYGQPLPTHPIVRAELTPPTGPSVVVPLIETQLGVFNASVTTSQSGIYRFRVLANGLSRRGRMFTREQLLTGVVGQPTRNPDGTPPGGGLGPDRELCKLLSCLLSDQVLTKRLRKRLEELGLDLDRLRRCVAKWCRPQRTSVRTSTEILRALENPETMRVLRMLVEEQEEP